MIDAFKSVGAKSQGLQVQGVDGVGVVLAVPEVIFRNRFLVPGEMNTPPWPGNK